MYFLFFVTFLVISLIIIALGLFRQEHSELAIIGFLFLFLLSFTFNTGIEYKTGYNTTYEYNNQGNLSLMPSKEIVTDNYVKYNPTGLFSHLVGYYLAIGSFIGFVAVLIGLKFTRFK